MTTIETLDSRVAFLQRQLHAISLAIAAARARDDQVALETLRALYLKVNAQVLELEHDAYKADAPGAFMTTLSALSDEAIKTGQQLRDAGVNIVTGAASIVKYLPVILVVALVAVALVYAGKIRKDLK